MAPRFSPPFSSRPGKGFAPTTNLPASGTVTASWRGPVGRRGQRLQNAAALQAIFPRRAPACRARWAAVGPELCGVLIDVCCHLKGSKRRKRPKDWPQRSGKVVLQIALTRLARHYGLVSDAELTARARRKLPHWGTEDYRPKIRAGDAPLKSRGAALGIGANSRHHRGEAIRSLLREMVAQPEPANSASGSRRRISADALPGIEASKIAIRPRTICASLSPRNLNAARRRARLHLGDQPDLAGAATHLVLGGPLRLAERLQLCQARSHSDNGPPSRPGG